MYERMQLLNERNTASAHSMKPDKKSKQMKDKAKKQSKQKRSKNAPAEFRSNRPVPILREVIPTSTPKFRDPRFSDISGSFDADKFHNAYNFLDQHQEQEISSLAKQLKKVKNPEAKEKLQKEFSSQKQQLIERRRNLKIRNKLKEKLQEEKEKVKMGKTPFHLKRAAKKQIALEERYDELKRSGRLNKFMGKKRKHDANKDHKLLPSRRIRE